MTEDFIEIRPNTFLFNAGIVGFVYLLENMNAIEDEDYIIEDTCLKISKDFLLNNDLSQAYINAHIEKFQEYCAFNRIMQEIENIKSLTETYTTNQDKETQKKLDEKYTLIQNIVSPRYLSACEALNNLGYSLNVKQLLKDIKDIKNYQEKLFKLNELKNLLTQDKVQETFLMKDIIHFKINRIWTNKAFLNTNNSKKDINLLYENSFTTPLKNFLQNSQKKTQPKFSCFECGIKIHKDKDTAFSISFLNDTTDDLARKKSDFWNLNPDTFICPVCHFIYSLAPLGFEEIDDDLIFINSNADLHSLITINQHEHYRKTLNNESASNKSPLLTQISEKILETTAKAINKVQVVIRTKEKYIFNTFSKDILELLNSKEVKSHLQKIKETKSLPINNESINIYQEVIKNIFSHKSQYPLISLIIMNTLKTPPNKITNCLKNILQIEITTQGGKDMTQNYDRAAKAKTAIEEGKSLKSKIAFDAKNKEIDNRVKSLVYKLTTALQTNDFNRFCHIIIRTYAGLRVDPADQTSPKGQLIPEIIHETFSSDEDFQYIGYAFVTGLQS